MKKVDSLLLKVFLCGLPVVAMLAILPHPYSGFLNTFKGLVFAVWMMFSIYLSVRLIVSGPFRDQVITRVTFIRERDEREAMLTAKAARTVFLTSLALLILLFCLSCFQVSLYRVPPEKAVDGKTRMLTLGLGFDFLEQSKQDRPEDAIQRKDMFSYRGLPVSSSTIILMLIIWQIVSYNYSMRRLMK